MDEVKRVIVCTEENAAQFRRVVRNWPQLHSLVNGLQAQGIFPGLRSVRITLTGTEKMVGKGLAALEGENALQRRPAQGEESTCN